MKKYITNFYSISVLIIVLLTGCDQSKTREQNFFSDIKEGPTPWTAVPESKSDSSFNFAIITDLNGGEREGVFEVAVAQLNLLRPEFILSVGDLVDGAEDIASVEKQYDSFDERVSKAKMPMFLTGGNHDLTSPLMRKFWEERYGRRYYHFVYQKVLFLVLDTEDYDEAFRERIHRAREEAIAILDGDHPEEYPSTDYYNMSERMTGKIEEEQNAYFEKVIQNYPNVRHTFILMHKPVWQREGEGNLSRIETALGSRNYTVINGHFHSYSYTAKNGHDYIMLGTTGGGQSPKDPNSFDHITMVSYDSDGPSIANIRLDGILDKTGKIPLNGEQYCYQASACTPTVTSQ